MVYTRSIIQYLNRSSRTQEVAVPKGETLVYGDSPAVSSVGVVLEVLLVMEQHGRQDLTCNINVLYVHICI